MDNTYTPLVSDERLHPPAFLGVNSWSGKEQMIIPSPMTAEDVRNRYESDRRQTHAELAELSAEVERMRGALQEVYDIYDRKGGVAPIMTKRAIHMVREALNQRH